MEEELRQVTSNCIRICLIGPESSGKSTLSQKLALYYKAPLVPEYAREYLQDLWDTEQKICRPKDLLPIAKGQIKLENAAIAAAAQLIICDTDILTTKIYSEVYYNGWCPELIEKMALENTYDLYLLTYIDTPWEKDDLRDRPERREEMFNYFKHTLEKYKKSFILVKGTSRERMKTATTSINTLLV